MWRAAVAVDVDEAQAERPGKVAQHEQSIDVPFQYRGRSNFGRLLHLRHSALADINPLGCLQAQAINSLKRIQILTEASLTPARKFSGRLS